METTPSITIWTPVGSAPAVKINSPAVIGLEIADVCKKSILKVTDNKFESLSNSLTKNTLCVAETCAILVYFFLFFIVEVGLLNGTISLRTG